MKYNLLFKSHYKFMQYCEDLAFNCCHFNCLIGKLPCPFGSKDCDDVTADDWAKIIKVIKTVQE